MLRWIRFLVFTLAFSPLNVFAATGYLDVPDACFILKSSSDSQVHVESVGECKGVAGRAFVNLAPGTEVMVVADGQEIGKQKVKSLGVVDVKSALDRGSDFAAKMQVPDNIHRQTMEAKAAETATYYNSTDFQSKLEAEMKEMMDGKLGVKVKDYYPALDAVKEGPLAKDERVYLFVSSSMPVSVLRTYVADISRLKDRQVKIVLRGFVGGMKKITPTVNFVSEVLKEDASCELTKESQCPMRSVDLLVDPLLFEKYGVEAVPSFVYVKGLEIKTPGGSEGYSANLTKDGDHISVAGDASLGYVMDLFAKESGSPGLASAAKALR